MIYVLTYAEHQPLIRAIVNSGDPMRCIDLDPCQTLVAGSFWRANWLGIGDLPPRLGAQLSMMQDTRRLQVRNLRKPSRAAVGPVRPVRLNNLHKHSHGLIVSATSSASDVGLCLGLESLENTVLLVGDEIVENAFSTFRSGRW